MPSVQQKPSGIMDILLTFLDLSILLANMAPSIHNLTYSEWEFLFFLIPTSICYWLSCFLNHSNWSDSQSCFICIFLILKNDDKYSWNISYPKTDNSLLRSQAYIFLIWTFAFVLTPCLLFVYLSYLCILDFNFLSDI